MKKMKTRIKCLLTSEFFLYAFFGVLTTIINIGLYRFLLFIDLNYVIANLTTLIVVKITAYIVNKLFVFKSKSDNFIDLMKEFLRYAVTRGITLLVDFFGLIIAVEWFCADEVFTKYLLQIVVVVLNYIFGKFLVFNKNKKYNE